MNNRIQQILEQLVPFVVLGVAIALVIGLFIMLTYVMFWGVFFGAIIWVAMKIKNYLFPSPLVKHEGRVIEHDRKN